MTEVIRTVDRWRELRRSSVFAGRNIGFVPTMGALHAGHRSLLDRSRRENDVSVLSIFVNPTQFDDPGDLRAYPSTLERDFELAQAAGVDYVLNPSPEQMYADGYRYRVSEAEMSRTLCGEHRPGHFDGVLTVVLKLLHLVQAQRAYFGEKDYQQLRLVKGMVEALFLDVEIVPCPIIRDTDGLALSSRNARLSPEERQLAAEFPRLLSSGLPTETIRVELEKKGFAVDYVTLLGLRRLGAVRLGKTRLIDNVPA